MLQNSELGEKSLSDTLHKNKKEKQIQIFLKNHLQSAGRYSVNFVLQHFVASYKFGSCPAINLCQELSLGPPGEFER